MKHGTVPRFWLDYRLLPKEIRKLADKNFALLKNNPRHPSLQLKRVRDVWAVRVGSDYRALGLDDGDRIVWFILRGGGDLRLLARYVTKA